MISDEEQASLMRYVLSESAAMREHYAARHEVADAWLWGIGFVYAAFDVVVAMNPAVTKEHWAQFLRDVLEDTINAGNAADESKAILRDVMNKSRK